MIVLGVPDAQTDHKIHQRDAQGNFSLNIRKTECRGNFYLDFSKIFTKIILPTYYYILSTPDSQKRYYDIQAILRKAPKGATRSRPAGPGSAAGRVELE